MLIAALRMALYLLADAPDLACEQPLVDACIDTAAPDGSTSCLSEDLPAVRGCPRVPIQPDAEHDVAHQLCELGVYAVLCPECHDDETTTTGERVSEALCRNEDE